MNLTLLAQDARSTTVGWQPVPGAACYALEWSDRMSDTVRFRTAGQTRDCRFRFVRSTHIPYYLRLRALDEAGSTLELSPVLTTPLARVLYPQLEALDRGLVAVATSAGVFLSWRLLRSEVDGYSATGLTGADFVVISILPGTFDEMESDVHAPEAYGIYQSVGDTVGAGGFMRAMRTIPMYVTIAEAIRDYSPNAWVINYTNPMTLCVRTLYHVFPKIKAFGCCHEVFGTQTLLTHILDEELGLKDVARQDIKVNVKGINHFTWFDKATYKGMDLFPIYRKFAEEHYESGYEYGDTNWMNSSFACANRVKFDLFLRYGCIAAAGDRHLAEFMPGKTYLESPEAVREWKFGLTTVAWRKNELQERLARSRRLRTGEEPIEIKPDGEEGHLLMKALLGLGDLVSNVNIPNHGAIANLPWDAVVEVNALFSRQGVQSVNAGPLPANILPLVARHVYNQENTLTAALTCDRTLGLTTFMNDPQVTLNWNQGKELFDTMLHNTRAYLPKEWNA